jgi:uncharacterized protein YndB with AHSA1/START domain
MAHTRATGHSTASPEIVWEILSDHTRMADWAPLRSSSLERQGDPPPDGVGAIRVLRAVGPPLREEITEFEPPKRLAYTVLSGLPVRNYRAEVELTPSPGGGTDVVWQVSCEPRIPGFGLGLRAVIANMTKRLVAAANERATAA